MRCGHIVESCGSVLFESALTATISSTLAAKPSADQQYPRSDGHVDDLRVSREILIAEFGKVHL